MDVYSVVLIVLLSQSLVKIFEVEGIEISSSFLLAGLLFAFCELTCTNNLNFNLFDLDALLGRHNEKWQNGLVCQNRLEKTRIFLSHID